MPRFLQPLALSLALAALILFRLIPSIDPINRLLIRGSTFPQPELLAEDGQLAAAEEQVKQLRQELGLKQEGKLVRVEIIRKTLAGFRQAIKLAAGSDQGLALNQPVLSGGYLIGFISSTEPDRATAILLGDADLRVPVVTAGGGEGIVLPQAGTLIVDQVLGETKVGAAVTTSGIEGMYEPGLLLGVLGAKLPDHIFARYVLDRPYNLAELTFVTVKID